MIEWKKLESSKTLQEIIEDSSTRAQVIFKHSTTCPISSMAKRRLENQWDLDVPAYYLDILSYRAISNEIADQLDVRHESPQMIVIKDGQAVYDASHLDIGVDGIRAHLNQS